VTIGAAPGCATCHSLQPGVRLVGPSLADVATVAASAVDGMSAEAFLRQSIVEPDAHVTAGFTPRLMFQNYGETLSEQQIDDLVAFLLTQK
jgi:cytochrome c551/c552